MPLSNEAAYFRIFQYLSLLLYHHFYYIILGILFSFNLIHCLHNLHYSDYIYLLFTNHICLITCESIKWTWCLDVWHSPVIQGCFKHSLALRRFTGSICSMRWMRSFASTLILSQTGLPNNAIFTNNTHNRTFRHGQQNRKKTDFY